ncbi:hypothetical protein B0H10DRAFT_1774026 [Mycena sp. CBHHK59/15]|nr:hypothetical protein B0H10DRAFT_1774026 [Mycena sp. CBHHK59/15]
MAEDENLKRKRPPSFQHFPVNRAKKLKQTWVQNTKVKSRWKAEKRKLGLGGSTEREQDGADVETAVETRSKDEKEEVVARAPPSALSTKKPARRAQAAEPEPDAGPSLRDRTRAAYSQTSLHTYKSDPFGTTRRRGGRTGRGQPDMRKRMGVMLEQIQRDFT